MTTPTETPPHATAGEQNAGVPSADRPESAATAAATWPISPRVIAIAVLVAAFTVYALQIGFPTKRSNVLMWVALTIVVVGLDHPRRMLRSFATIWIPMFAALAAYDLLRGLSDESGRTAHTWPHLDVDLWLGGGVTLSEWMQTRLWDAANPNWWDYLAWVIYNSHFFVPLLVGVALWALGSSKTLPYAAGIVVLSWFALATYWAYPAQPPWMTARDGLTGDVSRVVHTMWSDIGIDRAARAFVPDRGMASKYSNPVAALPSLHAAFPMFIAIMLWPITGRLRPWLAAYALAMGVTLIYAGEHFIFDVVMGWAYAAAAAAVVLGAQKILVPRISSKSSSPQAFASGSAGSESADRELSASR